MKTMMIALTATALLLLAGCGSPEGGGPGENETFRLKSPLFSTTIKQGDRQTVTVTVDREEQFKEDVTLTASAGGSDAVERCAVTRPNTSHGGMPGSAFSLAGIPLRA